MAALLLLGDSIIAYQGRSSSGHRITRGAASSCLLYEAALRIDLRMDSIIVMVLIAFCTGVCV